MTKNNRVKLDSPEAFAAAIARMQQYEQLVAATLPKIVKEILENSKERNVKLLDLHKDISRLILDEIKEINVRSKNQEQLIVQILQKLSENHDIDLPAKGVVIKES